MLRAVRMCRDISAANQQALIEYMRWRQGLWDAFNKARAMDFERARCEADEAEYLRWKSALHALKN
jgi:hypothetical protein